MQHAGETFAHTLKKIQKKKREKSRERERERTKTHCRTRGGWWSVVAISLVLSVISFLF